MLVKTPLKEKQNKQARPNKRAAPNKKGKNGSAGGLGKSSVSNGGVVYGKKKSDRKKLSLPSVPAWKIILGAIAIGALGVLYLSHVLATQQLLAEVQQLESEYQKVQRRYDDYRLTYDRMIGPKEIYEKAQQQGFINGGPADKVITVEEE